ncbi:MAG TPA: aminotransferase class V-fold PLP-dependent enzyme [Thermoanaerobaculia bacterium]|nr:aminotransferase class V-fold PLP-dependent enzyme [Thermoanaerobaculia bacterium]
MYSRRELLGAAAIGAAAAVLDPSRARAAVAAVAGRPGPADEVAADESFWFEIQQAFTVDRSIVNLNNGGVSPSPAIVQEAMKRHLDYSNSAPPPYALWQILEPQKEGTRKRLARAFGADPEEIAITRNASEGLQICQLGFDLERGDEILTSTQDYPRMLTTFDQRARREGIAVTKITIPVPAEDPSEVVDRFRQAITPRTKMILVSHMINLTGQILPAKEVVDLGRSKGIPVIVDGAHTFAHFDFDHADLGCDYYATSLHKWLFAPHGTGMLYVRRDKIRGLWPLMAAPVEMSGDVRKYEEIGTHPAANHLAIAEALTFHEGIGPQRKAARLRYLRDRWSKRLLAKGGVKLHTSLKSGLSCGIATVQVQGAESAKLAQHLWDKHRILVTPIVHPEFEGLRITPSVYTTLEEVDRFCEVMEEVAEKGLPA